MEMHVQSVRLQVQHNGQAGCTAVLCDALESAAQVRRNVCIQQVVK